MLRWMAGISAMLAIASTAVAQLFNVRAWYKTGQVFVVRQFPSPPAVQTDTVEIDSSLTCYHIVIGPAALDVSIAADTDVYVRSIRGDVTSSAEANLSDALFMLSRTGRPASNHGMDVNWSGGSINLVDALVKSRVTSPARKALCP